jgi:hypothetical protein
VHTMVRSFAMDNKMTSVTTVWGGREMIGVGKLDDLENLYIMYDPSAPSCIGHIVMYHVVLTSCIISVQC